MSFWKLVSAVLRMRVRQPIRAKMRVTAVVKAPNWELADVSRHSSI